MSTAQESTQPAFINSRSCRALCDALLAENRAIRFCQAAEQAMDAAHLHVIAHALRFTSAQEQEHEAIFRGLLTAFGTEAPHPPQHAPVLPRHPQEILARLLHTEDEAAEQLYPHFASIAEQEGYPRIADAFRRIAETEALHVRRFRQYASALADGSLFRNEHPVSWLCLGCGQFHPGCDAPSACSSCGRNQGHFIRSNHHPFMVEG